MLPKRKTVSFFSDWWYQNEVPWFFWWRSPLLHYFHSGTQSVTDRWYCLKSTALIFILNCLLSHSTPLPRQHWNPSTVWHALDVFECVLAPIKTLRLNFISVLPPESGNVHWHGNPETFSSWLMTVYLASRSLQALSSSISHFLKLMFIQNNDTRSMTYLKFCLYVTLTTDQWPLCFHALLNIFGFLKAIDSEK